jgi:hypothetical protein
MDAPDLSKTPDDPIAAKGYQELYRLLPADSDDIPLPFAEWKTAIRTHLDSREASFFSAPFEPEIERHQELLQTKTVARLYKILMDRQGFKVPREGGGLG